MMRWIIALIVTVAAVQENIEECLAPSDPTGEKYNGTVGTSETGKRCDRWGEGIPLTFGRFCRKIDGKDKPGCFVKSAGQRTFENCNIPLCFSRSNNILIVYKKDDDGYGNRQPVIMDATGQER